MFNPITCAGWETGTAGWVAAGGCFSARIGFVLLFFLIAVSRKWIFETVGIPFNAPLGFIGGLLSYLIMIVFLGSFKWAILVGIVMMAVAGIFGTALFGASEDTE